MKTIIADLGETIGYLNQIKQAIDVKHHGSVVLKDDAIMELRILKNGKPMYRISVKNKFSILEPKTATFLFWQEIILLIKAVIQDLPTDTISITIEMPGKTIIY